MPSKKTKEIVDQSTIWVVLYDDKNSSHHIVPQDKIIFNKKDKLCIGTYATYNGGDRMNRCRGNIIMIGTKEACEKSVTMIENTNNNNNKNNKNNEEDESDSNSSNELLIEEQLIEETSSSTQSLSSLTSTTTSARGGEILQNLTNLPAANHKRKEPSEQSTTSTKKVKRASTVSHSSHEKLQRENVRLSKELNMYKNNWMPRPSGAVAAYFIEIAKLLSGTSEDDDNDEEKGEKLEQIYTTLDRTESELKSCEHDMNITKTCRQIIKCLYPDIKQRAKMLVSSMDVNKLQAVHDYARIVHPAQSKTSNSVLNNAIGNVFASEKRKQERLDMEIFRSNDLNDYSEDDEDNEQ